MAGKVLILIGSASDAGDDAGGGGGVVGLRIPCEMTVASAHRSPGRTQSLAPQRGEGRVLGDHRRGGRGAPRRVRGRRDGAPGDRRAAGRVAPWRVRRPARPSRCPRVCRWRPWPWERRGRRTRGTLRRRSFPFVPELCAKIRAGRKAMAGAVEKAAKRFP